MTSTLLSTLSTDLSLLFTLSSQGFGTVALVVDSFEVELVVVCEHNTKSGKVGLVGNRTGIDIGDLRQTAADDGNTKADDDDDWADEDEGEETVDNWCNLEAADKCANSSFLCLSKINI